MATVDIAAASTSEQPSDSGVFQKRALGIVDVGLPASDGSSGGAVFIYVMRGYRTAGGTIGYVYWENETADLTNAPAGTIVDVGVVRREVR